MGVYYFGYGSNMSSKIMRTWCGDGFRLVGVASLADHRLAFNRKSIRWGAGAADVVPAAGQTVWGAVYELGNACLDAMDEKEALGVAYERMDCTVTLLDGAQLNVMTYTVIDKHEPELRPGPAYLETILEGAEENGLPADYQQALSLIKSNAAV
jgi:gamma-glutamylcyclotransferase (GGCT)/AIG2-like uncharacterized protein YtfP